MYKAIFTIPSLGVRKFWYVSNRTEGYRHALREMQTETGKRAKQYRDFVEGRDYFVRFERVFK